MCCLTRTRVFFAGTKSALHVCLWSCCYSNWCRGEAYIPCNLCFRNKKHQISAVIFYNICSSPHPDRKTDTVSYLCVSKCQAQNNVQVGLRVLASTALNSKLCSGLSQTSLLRPRCAIEMKRWERAWNVLPLCLPSHSQVLWDSGFFFAKYSHLYADEWAGGC